MAEQSNGGDPYKLAISPSMMSSDSYHLPPHQSSSSSFPSLLSAGHFVPVTFKAEKMPIFPSFVFAETSQQLLGQSSCPDQFCEPRDSGSEDGVEAVLGVAGKQQQEHEQPRRSRSKRSRAAEVHNLSEKRRRSRINEKMKALQSLIPNSNKTDKASMLDEAIEYLKQLQLQVQMLSMRNGLFIPPGYLSGGPETLQTSQIGDAGLAVSAGQEINADVGLVPANPNSAVAQIFDELNRGSNSHEHLVLPSGTNISVPNSSIHVRPSKSYIRSYHLPASTEEMFKEGLALKRQLHSQQTMETMQEAKPGCPENFRAHSSLLVDIFPEQPQSMLANHQGRPLFVPHFQE